MRAEEETMRVVIGVVSLGLAFSAGLADFLFPLGEWEKWVYPVILILSSLAIVLFWEQDLREFFSRMLDKASEEIK